MAMETPTLTPEQTRQLIERELCRRSFVDFLDYVIIESDNAAEPGPIKPTWWQYQIDQAKRWACPHRHSQIWLKRRQIGASWLVAAYMVWTAMYHESRDVGYYSRGQEEARHQLRRRCKYIYDHLPGHIATKANFTADTATFEGGSTIRVFPSTPDAGIGYTFKLVAMDEAAFHPYGESNYAATLPTLGTDGQMLVLSTANPELGEYGWFHDLWEKAQAGEVSLRPVFTGRDARPDQDAAFFERARKDFAGSAEAFNAYYPEEPDDAFVGKAGLVIPEFSRQRHVSVQRERWEDFKFRVAGIDPGGGDPTAVVPLGISGDWHFHQPGEGYWREAVTVDDLIAYLAEWHTKAPFDAIWLDAGRDSPLVMQLAQAFPGVQVDGAIKHKDLRIERHRWLLEHDRLTIHESCVNSIAEYAGYRWSTRVDPHSKVRYVTSTPVDHHADAMDARGYAILGAMEALRGNRTGQRVSVGYKRKEAEPDTKGQPLKYAGQYHARKPQKRRVSVR